MLYEIELVNPASDHYHSRVVEGPDAPAGEVPASVRRYADLLASIAGHDTEVKIGMARLVTLDDNGVTNDAWTVWLKEYTWGRTKMRLGAPDEQTECELIGGEIVS